MTTHLCQHACCVNYMRPCIVPVRQLCLADRSCCLIPRPHVIARKNLQCCLCNVAIPLTSLQKWSCNNTVMTCALGCRRAAPFLGGLTGAQGTNHFVARTAKAILSGTLSLLLVVCSTCFMSLSRTYLAHHELESIVNIV